MRKFLLALLLCLFCFPCFADTTRFYFPATGAADISPAFDAGWSYTSEAARFQMVSTKGSSTITTGTLIGPHTAMAKALDRQYVSLDLGAGLTFTSGVNTVKCQILGLEGSNTDNEDLPEIVVKIVSNDGSTVRATLLANGNFATNAELLTTQRNVQFADGDTDGATYTTVSGDRLVAELGYTGSSAQTTPEFSLRYGENATDLPEDQTTTTDGAGWLEVTYSTGGSPAVPATLPMMGIGM